MKIALSNGGFELIEAGRRRLGIELAATSALDAVVLDRAAEPIEIKLGGPMVNLAERSLAVDDFRFVRVEKKS